MTTPSSQNPNPEDEWGETEALIAAKLRAAMEATSGSRDAGPDADGPTMQLDGVGTLVGGRYLLLELVGTGGMGEVYKAQQREPIRRTVAVKLIKPGVDTREVVARFEAERQVLARMDHPGVARVLDAGSLPSGKPYFVMEYVPGTPLTRYADAESLTVRQRLELFLQVCEAVAHAHTKAVLHRDLKPGNVLAWTEQEGTTTRRRVKVIDFGIAKALSGDGASGSSQQTSAGSLVGTYDYMSPEQAAGDTDIDTRSDLYALGVVLYELLTGERPFTRPSGATSDEEVRRAILERQPERPSQRVATRATAKTQTAIARRDTTLERTLRSELEWIPLKAMRKERDRRYASVDELATDVRNYLAGHALIAGPESRFYRTRKFARRYRVPLAFAATVAALVIAGAVGTTVGLVREQRQRTIAETNARQAGENARLAEENARRAEENAKLAEAKAKEATENLLNFRRASAGADATLGVLREMISSASPDRVGGRSSLTVMEVVQAAEQKLAEGKLRVENPDIELWLRLSFGQLYQSLGQLNRAEETMAKALKQAETQGTADNNLHVTLNTALAEMDLVRGNWKGAEPKLKTAIALLEGGVGQLPESTRRTRLLNTKRQLAAAYYWTRQMEAGEKLIREVVAEMEADPEFPKLGLARALVPLSQFAFDAGRAEECVSAMERAVALIDALPDVPPMERSGMRSQLATAYRGARQFDRALATNQTAIDELLARFGEAHPAYHRCLLEQANILMPAGRLREAEALLVQILALKAKYPASRDITERDVPRSLLDVRIGLRDYPGAVEIGDKLWPKLREEPDRGNYAYYVYSYAEALCHTGQAARAAQVVAETQERMVRAGLDDTLLFVHLVAAQGMAKGRLGDAPGAIALLEPALQKYTAKFGTTPVPIRQLARDLAVCYADAGRLDDARQLVLRYPIARGMPPGYEAVLPPATTRASPTRPATLPTTAPAPSGPR